MAEPARGFPGESEQTTLASGLGPFWSSAKVRRELDLDTLGLQARQQEGRLLGLPTSDGVWVYPVAQFEERCGEVRVRPALVSMWTRLQQHDRWSVAQLLLLVESSELGGMTPLDAIRQGLDEAVLLQFAERIHREWS